MTNSIIFTSKKNYQWLSMQEIIPYIEDCWLKLKSDEHNVELVNIDDLSFSQILAKCFKANNIICTCFTVEISQIVTLLRSKVNIDFKLFFYVHGLASVAMWPLLKWDIAKHMTTNDYFVVSCDNDVKALQLAFTNANIIKHPFFIEADKKFCVKKNESFVYIGRISEQKNITCLIILTALLKKNSYNFKLDIIGQYDELGSPNMGMPGRNYDKYLIKLCEKFDVADNIKFLGFFNRLQINDYLENTSGNLISLSLHSDENFGAVPYMILKHGGRTILSNWGGYHDYGKYYPSQTRLISVYNSKYGPFVDLAQCYHTVVNELDDLQYGNLSEYKMELKILSDAALIDFDKDAKRLYSTSLAKELLDKREEYYKQGNQSQKNFGSQLFSSYQDPNAHMMFHAYGALNSNPIIGSIKKNKTAWLCADVELKSPSEILVIDYHLGNINIEVNVKDELTQVNSLCGSCYEIEEGLLCELLKIGRVILL